MYTIKIPNYLLWALDLSYVTALLRTTSTLKYFCFTPWFHPSWEGGWWGGYVVEGWGHIIFKQKLKLHDTSIKRIDFRIYFRDIWKMYLLVVEKNIFFNSDMSQVFGTLCCFSSRPFLKQLTSLVSADTLQLKFLGVKFLLIHSVNWNIFSGRFLSFLPNVN